MANRKDETGKGPPRPGESAAGKRPYATLDLQATEIPGKDSTGAPKADAASAGARQTDASTAPRSGLADGLRGVAQRAAVLANRANSGSFLSHMGAGALGALLVGIAGYQLVAKQPADARYAIDLHQLATRISDVEVALGTRTGDTSGLLSRTDELARAVRSLGDAQAQLANDTAALEGKIDTGASTGGQSVPQDIAQRLAKLEQALSAQPATESSEAAKAALATLDRELASIRTEAGRLGQRLDTVAGDVDLRLKTFARAADLAPLQAKVTDVERQLQSVLSSEAERGANSTRALLSLELAGLKRVMDRGEPFTNELAAVKRAAGDKLDLKPLERYMRDGVPTTADIAKSFRKVSDAMLDAEAEPADATLMQRLLTSARSIVRVRKAGHSPDDTSVEAVVARMDAALKEGRLAEVLAQGRMLPPKAALAGEDWLRQVEARKVVDVATASLEDQLKASLAGGMAGSKEPRR
jgi:hypothetical protein